MVRSVTISGDTFPSGSQLEGVMRWWNEQIVPRINDSSLGSGEVGELRDRAIAGLSGTVVELGFGSGLNIGHYPAAVTSVVAVEPSDHRVQAWQHRLQPLNGGPQDGCHITRAIADLVSATALDVEQIDTFYLPGPAFSRPMAYITIGRARKTA